MRDVTDLIEIVPKEHKPGRNVRDELHYQGEQIGFIEPQGWVIKHPHFILKHNHHERQDHVYKLTFNELEALKDG